MNTQIVKPNNTQTYMIKGVGGAILAVAVAAILVSIYIFVLAFVAFTVLAYLSILLCGGLAHVWHKILGRRR